MAREQDASVQENALTKEEEYRDNLTSFFLVKHFADKLLEERIVTRAEYDKLSVETAQLLGVQPL